MFILIFLRIRMVPPDIKYVQLFDLLVISLNTLVRVVTPCFYLILYYINIFELQIDIYFATRLNILVDIYDNIFGDFLYGPTFIPFGSVKYYSDSIFNSPKLFKLIEL